MNKLKQLAKIVLSIAPPLVALVLIGWGVGKIVDTYAGMATVGGLIWLDLTLTAHTKTKGGS